jgi:hypothetical protein
MGKMFSRCSIFSGGVAVDRIPGKSRAAGFFGQLPGPIAGKFIVRELFAFAEPVEEFQGTPGVQ